LCLPLTAHIVPVWVGQRHAAVCEGCACEGEGGGVCRVVKVAGNLLQATHVHHSAKLARPHRLEDRLASRDQHGSRVCRRGGWKHHKLLGFIVPWCSPAHHVCVEALNPARASNVEGVDACCSEVHRGRCGWGWRGCKTEGNATGQHHMAWHRPSSCCGRLHSSCSRIEQALYRILGTVSWHHFRYARQLSDVLQQRVCCSHG
jgi:hypothetical protein